MSLSLNDLDLAEEQTQSVTCDVCIVGAGALGSYLGAQLGRAGLSVVVLDAGQSVCRSPEEAGFVPFFKRGAYPAAIEGRMFGYGGSTARWGGLLVPHTSYDRDKAFGPPHHQTAWSFLLEQVDRAQGAVLAQMGFNGSADFSSFADTQLGQHDREQLRKAGLSVNASLMIPFRRKNLSFLLSEARQTDIQVFLNTVVHAWCTTSSGEVTSVSGVSPNGKTLDVHTDRFVLAAGAIESARILLEIRDSQPSLALSPDIGKCLGDHLSVAIAEVVEADQPRVASDFAPRFSGAWMRSFRFSMADASDDLPRSFSHFVFHNENPGFKLAKNVLGALQAKRLPSLGLKDYTTGIGGAFKLAHGRFLKSKLFIPGDTRTCLQLDVEQPASEENQITLSDQVDACGRKVPSIAWHISDRNLEQVRASAERLLDGWNASDLPRLDPSVISPDASKPHDAYHPVGTCRMGNDERAVVDFDLKVRGTSNLYSLTTGLLPSAGAANPTFSILCLAHQLGRQLSGEHT